MGPPDFTKMGVIAPHFRNFFGKTRGQNKGPVGKCLRAKIEIGGKGGRTTARHFGIVRIKAVFPVSYDTGAVHAMEGSGFQATRARLRPNLKDSRNQSKAK